MAQMIRYKGALYQRVDEVSATIESEKTAAAKNSLNQAIKNLKSIERYAREGG